MKSILSLSYCDLQQIHQIISILFSLKYPKKYFHRFLYISFKQKWFCLARPNEGFFHNMCQKTQNIVSYISYWSDPINVPP